MQVVYADATCPYVFGGAVYSFSTAVPSLKMTFDCQGTEASGLVCITPGGTSEARVGPYAGPGQAIPLTRTMFALGQTFNGSFLAI